MFPRDPGKPGGPMGPVGPWIRMKMEKCVIQQLLKTSLEKILKWDIHVRHIDIKKI